VTNQWIGLSILMAIFPGGPGLAGTIMYFVGAKDNGGGGATGAIRHAKLQ